MIVCVVEMVVVLVVQWTSFVFGFAVVVVMVVMVVGEEEDLGKRIPEEEEEGKGEKKTSFEGDNAARAVVEDVTEGDA